MSPGRQKNTHSRAWAVLCPGLRHSVFFSLQASQTKLPKRNRFQPFPAEGKGNSKIPGTVSEKPQIAPVWLPAVLKRYHPEQTTHHPALHQNPAWHSWASDALDPCEFPKRWWVHSHGRAKCVGTLHPCLLALQSGARNFFQMTGRLEFL